MNLLSVGKEFQLLKDYVEKEEFKGWDPYDGLNSKIFSALPIKKSRFFRLAWIQFFKRSPLNFRKLMLVPKDYNPKGLALFLTGYCNLYKSNPSSEVLDKINFLTAKIIDLQTQGYSGSCWGYNFDWQARAFFQPKYTPTVVASTFVGYALLDAYEITKNKQLLDIVRSTCDFVLNDLNRTEDEAGDYCFSYSPKDNTAVFNAGLLGAKLLSRVYSYTKEPILIESAKKTVSFCVKHQKKDGSWSYGTLPYHSWVDNFHTGYNLEAISEYQKYSGDKSFVKNIEIGLTYYLNTFFTKEGISKYYNNQIYPIDIHAPAQLIVTLYRMGELNKNVALINKVLHFTFKNMQSPKGFFFYQLKKGISSKIPYMRWAQAWMFYALSFIDKSIKA